LNAGLPVDIFTLQNPILQRLMECPLAALHADAAEVKALSQHIMKNSRRSYHALNRFAELHIVKNNANIDAVLVCAVPALGRVEVAIKIKPGYPIVKTFRAQEQKARELINSQTPGEETAPIITPFTLLTPLGNDKTTANAPARYNFDIRV
jgi:hypothetical protein